MAEWVIVFAPSDLDLTAFARRLEFTLYSNAKITQNDMGLDIQHAKEHVEVFIEDTAAILADYREGDTVSQKVQEIVARSPHPIILRITYYRGTDVLHTVLRTLDEMSEDCFMDNDYGVIRRLDSALQQGLPAFLAERGMA